MCKATQNDGYSDPKNLTALYNNILGASARLEALLMCLGKRSSCLPACRDFDENSQLMMGFHAQFLTIHQFCQKNKFQLGHISCVVGRHFFFPFVTLNWSCTCSIIIKLSADQRHHICKLTLKPIIFTELEFATKNFSEKLFEN